LIDYKYIEALFDIATCLSYDRDLMEFALPTIDAILCEERIVLKDIQEQIVKGSNKVIEGFLRELDRLWSTKLNSSENARPVVAECAIKILSVTYGELPKSFMK